MVRKKPSICALETIKFYVSLQVRVGTIQVDKRNLVLILHGNTSYKTAKLKTVKFVARSIERPNAESASPLPLDQGAIP